MASISSNVENISPTVIRRVASEIRDLMKNPLEGVSPNVDENDLSEMQFVIEGPACTPYADGKFVVKIVIHRDFPTLPPRGYFLTKIFHPNVSPTTGEICVSTLKKDWKPELGIRHILLSIKCLLIDPNPESALNEDAGKLLLENYGDFARRAKMMTEIHALRKKAVVGSQGSDYSSGSTEVPKVSSGFLTSKGLENSKKRLKRL